MSLLVGISFISWFAVGNAGAQTMTEFGAAAASSAVSGTSGTSVSDGIANIFGKVNQPTAKAAGKTIAAKKEEPALTVAPGAARNVDTGVPEPPPPAGHSTARQEPALPVAANFTIPVPFPLLTMADALPLQPIPPPPTMTPESLKQVTVGMSRAEVLRLGDPSSRVAMFEDGHMVETFSYRTDGQRFGSVRVQDGTVAKVDAK
jgi:hypothetical protein